MARFSCSRSPLFRVSGCSVDCAQHEIFCGRQVSIVATGTRIWNDNQAVHPELFVAAHGVLGERLDRRDGHFESVEMGLSLPAFMLRSDDLQRFLGNRKVGVEQVPAIGAGDVPRSAKETPTAANSASM